MLPRTLDFGVHHFKVTVFMGNPSFDWMIKPSEPAGKE